MAQGVRGDPAGQARQQRVLADHGGNHLPAQLSSAATEEEQLGVPAVQQRGPLPLAVGVDGLHAGSAGGDDSFPGALAGTLDDSQVGTQVPLP